MNTLIYHNPRCSKSRQTLQLLQEHGHDPEIVLYLETPPDEAALAAIVKMLKVPIDAILRSGEDDYKADRDKLAAMNDSEKARWLCQHPKVMQRPIVVHGNKAVIGRPPEAVLEILG